MYIYIYSFINRLQMFKYIWFVYYFKVFLGLLNNNILKYKFYKFTLFTCNCQNYLDNYKKTHLHHKHTNKKINIFILWHLQKICFRQKDTVHIVYIQYMYCTFMGFPGTLGKMDYTIYCIDFP